MKEPKTTKPPFSLSRPRFYRSLILVGLLFQPGATTSAAEYHLNRDKTNLVKFISEAPIEDFEGVTDKIDGYVLWEGAGFGADSNFTNSEIYFEVELAGLDTGIGLRNRHMRDNYLETDLFPYAFYHGKITNVVLDSVNYYTITSEGIFSVHGVERALSISALVSTTDTDLRVYCEFDLNLTDYNIDIPSLMFLKINETIHLFLDYYLKKSPINFEV